MPEFHSPLDLLSADATAPAADTVRLSRIVRGRQGLGIVLPNGQTIPLGPPLGWGSQIFWAPLASVNTVVTPLGASTPTTTGTLTSRAITATNALTRMKRAAVVSGTVAGNVGGQHTNAPVCAIGNGAGVGGFLYNCRFACSDAANNTPARQYVGLTTSTTAPTNVDPTTGGLGVFHIGIGHGASASNLSILSEGSGGRQAIDLGSSFPANTLSLDPYDFTLFADPFTSDVIYHVENMRTGAVATGTLAAGTNLPAATVFLAHRAWRTNNSNAAAVGLDLMHYKIDWSS